MDVLDAYAAEGYFSFLSMTECANSGEILGEMARKARAQRVPLLASFEITRRCCFRCVHCYAAGSQARGDQELDTDEARRILDELADAGCLFLLLTGGEPTLRQDFAEIYHYAVARKGFKVTLFTNAALIDENLATLLREWPPREVDVTLYGATPETYCKVTGMEDSFQRAMRGVERLLHQGTRVSLKTVVTSLNRHEFPAVQRRARAYGVPFRVDAALFPRLDGDPAPMAYRLLPEEAVDIEMADPERRRQWRKLAATHLDKSARLYLCGAGANSCHIDAHGNLQPCLMARKIRYSLRRGSFLAGWDGPIRSFVSRDADAGFACRDCTRKLMCGYCPAFFEIEMGTEQKPSAWLCRLGSLRLSRIQDQNNKQVPDEK